MMRRERGARNDNYSRVPEPLADAVKAAYVGARMLNAGSRPLPDFLIIGAQRCGTTSLYRYLAQHPQVIGAAPSKGVHYFDVNHERSLRWYRAHFPTRRRRDHAGSAAVTGEASPYYVFHPHGPDRVRAAVPNARLILMLRDPVVRAFSQYQQEYARGFEDAETFERALDLEPGRLAGERERMLADPGYDSRALQHHAYAARGEYAPQLEAWRARFDPAQIHAIVAEEFFADPAAAYRGVLDFLGLPMPPRPPQFKAFNARPAGGMAAETRERLAARFAEPNRRLEKLLGRRLAWTSPNGSSDG
ncbi:MAG TPA: sulfotransferase [Gaiellales bacterium]|nr:sulfotransferase [Gaiellales bacterium]